MFVLALGFGLGIITLTQAAVYHTKEQEAGIASALLNSAQQIGVALGLAILAGIAATISNNPQHAPLNADAQLVTGYGGALAVAAGLLIAAAILAALTSPAEPTTQPQEPATARLGESRR